MSLGEAAVPASENRVAEDGGIVLSQAKSLSAESEETGLWLWQGEAPPPRSRREDLSRRRSILGRILAAPRWTGWIGRAGGLIFILLPASLVLRSTPLDGEIPADARVVSPQPRSTLVATHSLIPPPSIELPNLRLEQVQMPLSAATQIMPEPREGQIANSRAQARSPTSVRRTHTRFARRGSPVLIPGLLTPPKD